MTRMSEVGRRTGNADGVRQASLADVAGFGPPPTTVRPDFVEVPALIVRETTGSR